MNGKTPYDFKTELTGCAITLLDKINNHQIVSESVCFGGAVHNNHIYRIVSNPIISPTGEFIATDFKFNINHNINKKLVESRMKQINSNYTTSTKVFIPNLTQKEEIILFYILERYSQHEIANKFDCSRSMIAQIIITINTKLGITSSSAKDMIDKAIELGFLFYIPPSLTIQI